MAAYNITGGALFRAKFATWIRNARVRSPRVSQGSRTSWSQYRGDSDRVDARSEQRRTNERPVPHRSRLYPVAIAPCTDSITQTKTLSASDTLMQSKAERC